MVDENTGKPESGVLPEFLDPETGGSDAASPNLDEIESILASTAKTEKSDELDSLDDVVDDDLEFEPEATPQKASKSGIALLVIAVVIAVVGIFMIAGNEKWQQDLDCFLNGNIAKCKMEKVERLRAQWRKEDRATKPKYGDLVLTYYPQDATVTIEQTMRKQEGWNGPLGEPIVQLIPNKSTELKENEVIEQLPLIDLPIRERERTEDGEIKEVRHYEYHIKIEREGYHPREFHFEESDWMKLGPEVNYSIQWNGCDLVPKPETVKPKFVAAMREIYCANTYFNEKGEKAGMTEAQLRGQRKEIQIRHGFKTTDEFEKFRAMLTADEAWWKAELEKIKAEPCPEPEAAP